MRLTIATCQFPVGADVRQNASLIARQLRQAKERGAHVAHFCECALSGYAGVDVDSYEGFDWALLEDCSREILALARKLRLWVVLGSIHRLGGRRKPHNCVYVINDRGELVDRYDKRFCAGDQSAAHGELAHYSPGDHPVVFMVQGIRCGVLICHEYRYPELYRDYKTKDVQVIFHSFHAGHVGTERLAEMRAQVGEQHHKLNHGTTLPEITMPAAVQTASACNHLWISASNTSARESCWPAFFVRPDGVVTGRLRRNAEGLLLSTVDTKEQFYDSTAPWRPRAIRGQLHSGTLVKDPRSKNRTEL